MSRTLFPILPAPSGREASSLPLLRDVAMDYSTGLVRFAAGEPVMVEGAEAVYSWSWRMLHTARYRYSHLSWTLGNELEALVGRPYREESKRSEARRYVAEALLQSPYITAVDVTDATLEGSTLCIHATMQTVYGEVTLHV